jgi:DNA-binding NarL/FixJ family response regulator
MNGVNSVSKLLVVDDHILFREGLMGIFQTAPDFEVVGGAGNVYEGIEMARSLSPDIVLMDFSLPDGTGLDATRAILLERPHCKIVFLTVNDADDKLFAAIRQGAKGYMLKNIASANLISSLRALRKGEMAITRQMASRVIGEFSHTQESNGKNAWDEIVGKLSPRELDVLREIESGATNLEIAQRLYLSENTVKHHMRNVLDKLQVENRRQAAMIARQSGLRSRFSSPVNM